MRYKQNARFPIHARPVTKIKRQKYKKTSEKRTKNQGWGAKMWKMCGFCGVLIFHNANGIQSAVKSWRAQGFKVAFVPTMGALHDGHLALVAQASQLSHVRVVCSIFVNPTQFNDPADLRAYPRNPANDLRLLSDQGRADALFLPEVDEVYPPENLPATFSFGVLEEVMEGAMRPGHFRGVGQVVARLLQLVEADYLLLGEKDYQQFMVVRDLLRQLREKQAGPSRLSAPQVQGDERNSATGRVQGADAPSRPKIPELIMGTTHRDEGGLALSSRNQRLSTEGRTKARQIYAGLHYARLHWKHETPDHLVRIIQSKLAEVPEFQIEYIQLADSDTLTAVQDWKNHLSVRIFAAVWIEGVRLIDNTVVFP
jgi:pantoate--beta-alanine ligase